jgi:hypothetical protein
VFLSIRLPFSSILKIKKQLQEIKMIRAQLNPTTNDYDYRSFPGSLLMDGESFRLLTRRVFGGSGCQRRTAEFLGVTEGTVGNWVHGRVPVPKYAIVSVMMLSIERDQARIEQMLAVCAELRAVPDES